MKENQDFNKRLNEAIKKGRDKKSVDGLENAKILPQARDLEEAVLGAVMLEVEAFDKVVDIIKPESFYVDAHLQTTKQRLSPDRAQRTCLYYMYTTLLYKCIVMHDMQIHAGSHLRSHFEKFSSPLSGWHPGSCRTPAMRQRVPPR